MEAHLCKGESKHYVVDLALHSLLKGSEGLKDAPRLAEQNDLAPGRGRCGGGLVGLALAHVHVQLLRPKPEKLCPHGLQVLGRDPNPQPDAQRQRSGAEGRGERATHVVLSGERLSDATKRFALQAIRALRAVETVYFSVWPISLFGSIGLFMSSALLAALAAVSDVPFILVPLRTQATFVPALSRSPSTRRNGDFSLVCHGYRSSRGCVVVKDPIAVSARSDRVQHPSNEGERAS